MLKYVTALSLITAMGIVISIIDARSSDVIGPRGTGDHHTDSNRTIYATGNVEGATEDIELRAEQFGRAQEVVVTEGQWVDAGDVLIRLESERQQQEVALASARLELARAELERLQNGPRAEERDECAALTRAAEARVDQAVRNLELVRGLRKDRAVTEQEVDDQQSLVDTLRAELEAAEARAKQIEAPARADEMRAAEARVAAAQAELNLANISLSKFEVRAPRRGRVLDINVDPGELTDPQTSQPLVILSDTSIIRVRAFIEELDAPRVKIGMPARVTADGLPNQSFTGRVISISPRMASKSLHSDRPDDLYDTKVREVILELADSPQLIVGFRVDVEFEADFHDELKRGT